MRKLKRVNVRRMRLGAALSCLMTLGAIAGPMGVAPAHAEGCADAEVEVPSLRIEMVAQSRSVRRGETAKIVARVVRSAKRSGHADHMGRPETVVPAENVNVFVSLSVGRGTALDGGKTDDKGYLTLSPRIPAKAPLGHVDAFSSAEKEIHRAGCIRVVETGAIEIHGFLKIKA